MFERWRDLELGKKLSLIIAVGYLVSVCFLGGGDFAVNVLRVLVLLVLSLGLIWFGDEIGGYSGPISLTRMVEPTPGVCMRFIGWVLLLLPLIVIVLTKAKGHEVHWRGDLVF